MKSPTQDRGLFAALALASLASASFTVWSVAQDLSDRWMALQPEIYAALLRFLVAGVIA